MHRLQNHDWPYMNKWLGASHHCHYIHCICSLGKMGDECLGRKCRQLYRSHSTAVTSVLAIWPGKEAERKASVKNALLDANQFESKHCRAQWHCANREQECRVAQTRQVATGGMVGQNVANRGQRSRASGCLRPFSPI